ncbi:MAG: zf-HC2 domain-containing protein [Chitinispirillaceae bacterium]|nr:zf-HC2 domain-containing protein [Chitinispirillaceae bacterium]
MKRCRKWPFIISRFVDGDLTADEAREAAAHIEVCRECSRIRNGYLQQKELVAMSFSDRPLPASLLPVRIVSGAPKNSIRVVRFGFACVFVLLCAIGIRIFYHNSRSDLTLPTVILESSFPSTMSSPLSALVYYEEIAGTTVHSQFVKLTSRRETSQMVTDREYIVASYYESPLFHDNRLVIEEYAGESDDFLAQ